MKKIIISATAIVLLAIGGVIFYQYKATAAEKSSVNIFGQKREAVMLNYVDVVVGFSPEMLKNPPSRCDQYAKFTSYFSTDTRQMSVADLQDALKLWDTCHSDVTSDQYEIDSEFSGAISELKGAAVTIKNPDISNLTNQIADDWRKIELLESEKTDLQSKSVDDAQSYWQAQLGYNLKNDSFSQRQDTYATLNAKEDTASKRTDEIKSQMKEISTEESDLWNEFMAKTGYKELTTPTKNSQ